MAQSSEFIYISGQGEDLRQPKDWHTVAQVNQIEIGDSSLKNYTPVDVLTEKEWERHKDIPHRFDEIQQQEWMEVKEVIKSQRELDGELERSKPKPPTDSEDEVFMTSKSQRNASPNRQQYKNNEVLDNISESSSMESVTNGMVAWGLGKVSSNSNHYKKSNRKKNIKKQEINFKGKFTEKPENHKFYPKEIHPKALYIPPPDYTDDEIQDVRSPAQKYYYEALLLEGIPETIPRPKLFNKQERLQNRKYNETETFERDEMGVDHFNFKEYGDNYEDQFEYHESEYIQEYENYVNAEYLDHSTEYGSKESYYIPEYQP